MLCSVVRRWVEKSAWVAGAEGGGAEGYSPLRQYEKRNDQGGGWEAVCDSLLLLRSAK